MKFPLKEIQSTRTQRPTASSSYPYVEIALGDVATQHTMQLQLEQVGPALAPGLSLQPSPSLISSTHQDLCQACLHGRSGPGHTRPRSIQPGAGDRADPANPTEHRTVGH